MRRATLIAANVGRFIGFLFNFFWRLSVNTHTAAVAADLTLQELVDQRIGSEQR
jgi:hypothetical protein